MYILSYNTSRDCDFGKAAPRHCMRPSGVHFFLFLLLLALYSFMEILPGRCFTPDSTDVSRLNTLVMATIL